MVVVERLATIFKSIMQNIFFGTCLLYYSLLKAHSIVRLRQIKKLDAFLGARDTTTLIELYVNMISA